MIWFAYAATSSYFSFTIFILILSQQKSVVIKLVLLFVLELEAFFALIVLLNYGSVAECRLTAVGCPRLHLFLSSLKFNHTIARVRLVGMRALRDLASFNRINGEVIPRNVVKNAH